MQVALALQVCQFSVKSTRKTLTELGPIRVIVLQKTLRRFRRFFGGLRLGRAGNSEPIRQDAGQVLVHVAEGVENVVPRLDDILDVNKTTGELVVLVHLAEIVEQFVPDSVSNTTLVGHCTSLECGHRIDYITLRCDSTPILVLQQSEALFDVLLAGLEALGNVLIRVRGKVASELGECERLSRT